MRKLFPYFFIFFILLSCSKNEATNKIDKENANNEQEVVDETSGGNEDSFELFPSTQISVSLELPEESSSTINDLTIFTLLDSKEVSVQNGINIDIFQSTGYELVFAENKAGEIILMGFLNPSKITEISLGAESTALALPMLHPWALHFSEQIKTEIRQLLKESSGFQEYLVSVNRAIAAGDLGLVKTDAFIKGFLEELTNETGKEEITFNETPINIEIKNGSITVTNIDNINAYGVGLFSEGDEPFGGSKLVEGVNKELFSVNTMVSLINGGSGTLEPQEVILAIPENGSFLLKLDTGIKFPNTLDDNSARILNYTRFFANAVGLFAPEMKKVINNQDCFLALADVIVDPLRTIIDDYLSTGDEGVLWENCFRLFAELADSALDITTQCILQKTKDGLFKRLLVKMTQLDRAESAGNLGFYAFDWFRYPETLEFCFEQQENEVFYCNGIDISGDLDFGNLEVGLSSQRVLNITNNLDEEVEIISIQLGEGYTVNWSNGTIPSNQTQEVQVEFSPVEEIDYNGELVIESDALSEEILLVITGKGIATTEDELEQENIETMERYRWDIEYSENCTFSHTSSSFDGVQTTETSCPQLSGYFSGSTFVPRYDSQDNETYEVDFVGSSVNLNYNRIENTNTQETSLTSSYSYQYDKENNTFVGTYYRTYYAFNPIGGSWLRYVWSGSSILRSSPRND
jgi:hypothetical protein